MSGASVYLTMANGSVIHNPTQSQLAEAVQQCFEPGTPSEDPVFGLYYTLPNSFTYSMEAAVNGTLLFQELEEEDSVEPLRYARLQHLSADGMLHFLCLLSEGAIAQLSREVYESNN